MKILLADQLMINVAAMNMLFSAGGLTIIDGRPAVGALHTARMDHLPGN
ncbi:hypothetical protein [Chitinophaga filiformis]|uniref:Uncharacterized protein n=1 Tax=Chitinophaga filiformis TaxID=104663 RepID=A0ABY4HZ12_CHIFI|nr:hypothetical protein [Chitinophaga filiformis]UPK68640.1 hypothetical protein MYF79_27145 [Chitinophaga filiformis]